MNLLYILYACLKKKIGWITDSLTSQHITKVGNYGIGGSYQVHGDYHVPSERLIDIPPTGNRIATLMAYLEAPESGINDKLYLHP